MALLALSSRATVAVAVSGSACCRSISSAESRSTCIAPRGLYAVPASVKSARLGWTRRTSKNQSKSPATPFRIFAAAEEAAPPAVTTETVPRPTKIGKGVVRLRLTRLGRKKRPFFRIVATHHSWRRDGKYIELLGHYNPLHAKGDLGIVLKADRIKYWLGVGAQPSSTVTGMLYKLGILKKTPEEANQF